MHVEITPAGRLVGKVLRVFFRGLLFGIPLAMVVTLLFYGVRCTGSLVGSMLGAGRAPQVAMVAPSSLPPTQVAPAQPLPRSEKSDRPQESAATPDTPLVPPPLISTPNSAPVEPAPVWHEVGYGVNGQNLAARSNAVTPTNEFVPPDLETERFMAWYFGDVPTHTISRRTPPPRVVPTTEPTTRPAKIDQKQDRPKRGPTNSPVVAAVTSEKSPNLPEHPVAASGVQQQANAKDRKPSTQPTKPPAARSQGPTTRSSNPTRPPQAQQADRSKANSGVRRGSAPTKNTPPQSDGKRQGKDSDDRKKK